MAISEQKFSEGPKQGNLLSMVFEDFSKHFDQFRGQREETAPLTPHGYALGYMSLLIED